MSPNLPHRFPVLRNVLALATALAVMCCVAAGQDNHPVPQVEVFGGYSWMHPGGTLNNNKVPDLNKGFALSGTYNFSKYLGLTLDGAGHYSDFSHVSTLMVGPTLSLREDNGIRYFLEAMGGLHRFSPSGFSSSDKFGLRTGGGMDFPLTSRLSWRVIQADYVWAQHRFVAGAAPGGLPLSQRVSMRGVELRTGLVYGFGSLGPPPTPPSATATAQPTEVFAGEPVTVTAAASNFNPKHTLKYDWSGTGGQVQGKDTTANVDTSGLAPGNYTVTVHVTDPKQKKYNEASANAQFTVKEKPKHPPTISCTANPESVQAGASSTITCETSSPDNVPVTTEFSSSGGQVTPSGNTASLATAGAAPGAITVTAKATDSRGLTADTTTSVNVTAPPPPPPQASKINEVEFPSHARPWRVDNTAKAILDDVALRLQREPDAKLVIVGYQDPNTRRKNLAAIRAVNTKQYLVEEKGIDAGRIEVRTGTGAGSKAELWLVPAGASFTEEGTQPVDESKVKPYPPRYPARHAHRKPTRP